MEDSCEANSNVLSVISVHWEKKEKVLQGRDLIFLEFFLGEHTLQYLIGMNRQCPCFLVVHDREEEKVMG